ncbi:hypothetical protein EVAR_36304_1 [Eumeta japonica]|uniref:Uncharacterized protein n=1 Tax=Eumeta variegata TaxID=151549 RepID=A0A4C1VIX9_EUMVA|nr:hypothetical protein EVAR_36304_1 [Eumeta japonica]
MYLKWNGNLLSFSSQELRGRGSAGSMRRAGAVLVALAAVLLAAQCSHAAYIDPGDEDLEINGPEYSDDPADLQLLQDVGKQLSAYIHVKVPIMFALWFKTRLGYLNLGVAGMWFQTIVADLRFQAGVHPPRRQLRPPARRLLPLLLLPLQPLGLQLQVPADGPLPEVGLSPPAGLCSGDLVPPADAAAAT